MSTFPILHLHSENYLSFVFISGCNVKVTGFNVQAFLCDLSLLFQLSPQYSPR